MENRKMFVNYRESNVKEGALRNEKLFFVSAQASGDRFKFCVNV